MEIDYDVATDRILGNVFWICVCMIPFVLRNLRTKQSFGSRLVGKRTCATHNNRHEHIHAIYNSHIKSKWMYMQYIGEQMVVYKVSAVFSLTCLVFLLCIIIVSVFGTAVC